MKKVLFLCAFAALAFVACKSNTQPQEATMDAAATEQVSTTCESEAATCAQVCDSTCANSEKCICTDGNCKCREDGKCCKKDGSCTCPEGNCTCKADGKCCNKDMACTKDKACEKDKACTKETKCDKEGQKECSKK